MRALITGISGQDGGYLADRLVADGAEVHGLVRAHDADTCALLDRLPEVKLHEGDLADLARVRDIVAHVAPHELYSLGGVSSVAESWDDPVTTGLVSGIAVAALLEAAFALHEAGHPVRVLQASSSELFGAPASAPQHEGTPVAPVSPYGVAKAYAAGMCTVFRGRGLPVATVILFNHESPRRPETFVTRKITAGVARIAAGRQHELVLGDLDVERDWGWAPDYVEAMVLALRHPTPDDYVIATGRSHSVREFTAAAFAAAGIDDWESHVRIDHALSRPAEVPRMLGDAARARELLGWRPTVDFDELVRRMVAADLERMSQDGTA